MKTLIAVIVGGWLLCGIIAAGGDIAYFQDEFPIGADKRFRKDLSQNIVPDLIFGPMALIVTTSQTGFFEHGWRLWRK